MAARNNARHDRATIAKIRESIDTRAAIEELHCIGHDKDLPPGVRVKALSVLLDKTMPSLTEKDINHYIEPPDMSQTIAGLIAIMGEDAVRERWPDVYGKYKLGEVTH
jgi:hypothetical protein